MNDYHESQHPFQHSKEQIKICRNDSQPSLVRAAPTEEEDVYIY